ncbi:MAG: aminoglycoside phosphotransferase family protein [Lachnospiraceae bacterium]|nr:aminoglycoside phosphotransferase family protein [Lachnospiraceae bacterium]
MERENLCAKIDEARDNFRFDSEVVSCERYGNGHINDTFLVKCSSGTRYIFQRMNHLIFRNPEELMKNVCNVTSFLRKKIIANGGDPDRETMNVVLTKDGKPYYKDSIGSYWRVYLFVEESLSFDVVEKPEDFYQSAYAFGRFQFLLSDFDASQLFDVIPDFHNTPKRFEHFKEVVAKNELGRNDSVKDEIQFVMDRAEDMKLTYSMLESGELPLRVTHNDTKLNNVLIDKKTGMGLCVIDLDTVMPGLSINDFGDSIRFGANTAAEDEKDISKVSLSLDLFETYAKGFLKGCGGKLTDKELEMMPYGAKTMTLECGMRFLTDYLEGDTYFRTHYEGHNVVRCHTQFELVRDMERKMDDMKAIIAKIKDSEK